MAFSFGINGGDSGDSFMDAPQTGSGRGKSGGGSGENPLSSFLNLVGVHIGESNSQKKAIESGDGTGATGGNVQPVSQGDSNVVNLNPAPPVYDSHGDLVYSGGLMPQSTQQIQVPQLDVPKPSPIHSFLSDVGKSILGGNDTASPGGPQIDGNKDGSYGGGLGKALLKIIGL